MADLIKKIKIKKQDGTFTDYIPIGAEAKNVSTEDGDSVELKLNKKIYHFKTVQDMINCTTLKIGDVCETLGYTYEDDKGTGTYEIVENDTKVSTITLSNNLKAKLIRDDSKVEYIFPNRWPERTIGDVIIVKALGKNILIDTHRDTEWDKVVEFLNDNNIEHIDYFFLSHYHRDHMGNFVNLVENDYIDENTILYMPQTSTNISAGSLYQEVHDCINENNFTYTIPEEFEVLNLGMNISLEFYNTDATYIETASQTEWNNCSMLIMFKHQNIKTLFTGDAQTPVFNRALTNGFFKEKIDMLKIPHHGMIYGLSLKSFEILRPDYAVQTSELLDHQQSFQQNLDLSYLAGIGTKFWATYNSNEYIIFESEINSMQNVQGKPINNISNANFTFDLYVDANSTNLIQDGKQDTPFVRLEQAMSRVERMAGGVCTIHIADGDYCVGTPISASLNNFRPMYMGNDTRIVITGNTSDVSAVKIHNGFMFYNAKVQLNYLTIYTNVSTGIYSENSEINLNRVTITSEDENATTNHGIVADKMSRIVLMSQVSISKCKEGIRTNGSSIVDIIGATVSDNTDYGISNNFSTINVLRKLTIENNTTDIYNNIGRVNRDETLILTNNNMATGITLSASYERRLCKQNKLVHLGLVASNSSDFGSTAVTVLTVPEIYKPALKVKALVGLGNDSDEVLETGYCIIETTGEVKVYNNSGTNYSYVSINLDYYTDQL